MTDYLFYSQIYGGSADEAEITPKLKRADEIIGCCVCKNLITEENSHSISFAACIQADNIICLTDKNPYSSLKLGDFSVSGQNEGSRNIICPSAAAYLESCGLLYRGGVTV